MEILQGILVTLGLIASWCVGWYGVDWVKWLFSLRFHTTDTHLVIETKERITVLPDNLLTPNERRARISQPSVYVPPPKPPNYLKPQDVYNQLWDYYDEVHQKQLITIDRILSESPIFTDIERSFPNHTDCAQCGGNKQYADNVKYLNIRTCECTE